MAGTIIAASPLITRLEGQSLGYTGVTLSNFDNTDEPQIIGNFEIAGSIGSFASLESITGWSGLSNGTVYIKIVPDTGAGTCAAAFTDTAPTWDNTKMGWYGTGGDANHRYLFKLTKGGASLYEEKSHLSYGRYNLDGAVKDRVTDIEADTTPAQGIRKDKPVLSGTYTQDQIFAFLDPYIPDVGDGINLKGFLVTTALRIVDVYRYSSTIIKLVYVSSTTDSSDGYDIISGSATSIAIKLSVPMAYLNIS